MSIRERCPAPDCGLGGILCFDCLLRSGEGAPSHPSAECRNTLAWMRGEPGATPPAGFEWGPPQAFSPAEITPLTPEEIAAADVGEPGTAWSELLLESQLLDTREAKLERDQAFLADSWVRLQADREALDRERLTTSRQRDILAAVASLLALSIVTDLPRVGLVILALAVGLALGRHLWRCRP